MDATLRIPVTAEQKRLISEAAAVNPLGMAAWAREILVRTATEQAAGVEARKPRRRADQDQEKT